MISEKLYERLLNVSPDRLEKLGREKLRDLLTQCTEGQVQMFNKLYKSVDVIPLDKMNCALNQVERTIAKYNKKLEPTVEYNEGTREGS